MCIRDRPIELASSGRRSAASIPTQNTRGDFPEGKNPALRKLSSIGAPRTVCKARWISSSLFVSPRNCNVMWNVSGATQRTSGASSRMRLRNSMIRWRIPGSMSSATKRRINLHEHAAHQIERLLARPSANAITVSKETPLYHFLLVTVGDRDVHQANRLLFRAATGTCDARDSDADVGIATLANVFR